MRNDRGDFRVGMTIWFNGELMALIEDAGTPKEMPTFKRWIGDQTVHEQVLHMSREYGITRVIMLSFGKGYEVYVLPLFEQDGRWRMLDGTFVTLESLDGTERPI